MWERYPTLDPYLHGILMTDPPMATLKELQDGTYSIEDVALMNDILDLKAEMAPKPRGGK